MGLFRGLGRDAGVNCAASPRTIRRRRKGRSTSQFPERYGNRESDAQVAKLAESFMAQYPDSRYEAHVRMKLGETFYRRGDYLGARGQFGIVAERFSDSPFAEKAVFLTAQAMARSLDPSEMEEAIEIFEQVVKSGGPLSLRARLSQAGLLNALKRPEEALGVLDRILESKPDPELRYTALIEKGDTLFSQGAQDAEITGRPSHHGNRYPRIPLRRRCGATKPLPKWEPLAKSLATMTPRSIAITELSPRARKADLNISGSTRPVSTPDGSSNPKNSGRSDCRLRKDRQRRWSPGRGSP